MKLHAWGSSALRYSFGRPQLSSWLYGYFSRLDSILQSELSEKDSRGSQEIGDALHEEVSLTMPQRQQQEDGRSTV